MADVDFEKIGAMVSGLAARLRSLQNQRNWTVQEMAELAHLPKRTLENYMRASEPQLPGVEAAAKMAIAYGISLDWLLFGDAYVGHVSRLTTEAARAAALPYIETIISHHKDGAAVVTDTTVLGFTAPTLAMAIGKSAGKRAAAIAEMGGAHDAVKLAAKLTEKMLAHSDDDLPEL